MTRRKRLDALEVKAQEGADVPPVVIWEADVHAGVWRDGGGHTMPLDAETVDAAQASNTHPVMLTGLPGQVRK